MRTGVSGVKIPTVDIFPAGSPPVCCLIFRYDGAMELSLHIVWKKIPEAIERAAAKTEGGLDLLNRWAFLYTVAACTTLAAGAGACVKYVGFPGDLPNVIQCVHALGYVPINRALPMICVSLFSIAAGGSVGPEAPLVAVSASVSGWLSMRYFKHDIVMVRKCTLISMCAGLSAFFGVLLGGKFLFWLYNINGATCTAVFYMVVTTGHHARSCGRKRFLVCCSVPDAVFHCTILTSDGVHQAYSIYNRVL